MAIIVIFVWSFKQRPQWRWWTVGHSVNTQVQWIGGGEKTTDMQWLGDPCKQSKKTQQNIHLTASKLIYLPALPVSCHFSRIGRRIANLSLDTLAHRGDRGGGWRGIASPYPSPCQRIRYLTATRNLRDWGWGWINLTPTYSLPIGGSRYPSHQHGRRSGGGGKREKSVLTTYTNTANRALRIAHAYVTSISIWDRQIHRQMD